MNQNLKKIITLAVVMVVLFLAGQAGLIPTDTGRNAAPAETIQLATQAPTEAATQAPAAETAEAPTEAAAEAPTEAELTVDKNGEYTSKEEVALYLYQYGHLPGNYITKKQAQDLGWVSSQGNLWQVAPGKSIGGDRFGNYEGSLPDANGRKYYECDIDFDGKFRNAKRILFSNDGLIFYTDDHYTTFTMLYGEE